MENEPSMRDLFALFILNGLLASDHGHAIGGDAADYKLIARRAYHMADAFIEVRKETV